MIEGLDNEQETVGHAYRNDRCYDIVMREPSLQTRFTYRIYHKHDSGNTRVGFYYESTLFPNHYSAICSLKHIEPLFNESMERCIEWLLDQHEAWLDEKFEEAFKL